METWLVWEVEPCAEVGGAEEEGVEDGVGVSTIHILGRSQYVKKDHWKEEHVSTCGLL